MCIRDRGNLDSGIRIMFGLWNPESWAFLSVISAQGFQNTANEWNTESKRSGWQGIRNPKPGIRKPKQGIQNQGLLLYHFTWGEIDFFYVSNSSWLIVRLITTFISSRAIRMFFHWETATTNVTGLLKMPHVESALCQELWTPSWIVTTTVLEMQP